MRRYILWTSEALCDFLNVNPAPRPFVVEAFQETASLCKPGVIFAPTLEMDTHENARDAFQKGAVAVISKKLSDHPLGHVIKVNDVDETLQKLAFKSRSDFKGTLIGVTGSTGKTTLTAMIEYLLSQHDSCFSTNLNRNDFVGITRVLSSMPNDSRYAVIETATGHPGCITTKTKLLKPHISIITNVGWSHPDFENEEEILKEKASIFDEHPQIGIIGQELLNRYTWNCDNLITVGNNGNVYPLKVNFNATTTEALINVNGTPVDIFLRHPGKPFVVNSMFALALVNSLGLDVNKYAKTLCNFRPQRNRTERYKVNFNNKQYEIIDDTFNASPDSCVALLDMMSYRTGCRKVLVWHSLASEFSEASGSKNVDALTEPIKNQAILSGLDVLIAVGPENVLADKLEGHIKKIIRIPSILEAQKKIANLVNDGDLIAVKSKTLRNDGDMRYVVDTLAPTYCSSRATDSWMVGQNKPYTGPWQEQPIMPVDSATLDRSSSSN